MRRDELVDVAGAVVIRAPQLLEPCQSVLPSWEYLHGMWDTTVIFPARCADMRNGIDVSKRAS